MTDGPCLKPDCKCCLWFMDVIRKMIVISGGTISMLDQAIKGRMAGQKTIQKLESRREALTQDNDRYKTANKELNAKVNKIKIVSVNTRTSSGRVGRPKGTKPTINKKPEKVDREETSDCEKCPKCGGGRLSARVCDRFDHYVERMQIQRETVKYIINRRYCADCKDLVHENIPGVAPYARYSANYGALMASLVMNGFSHGKATNTMGDVLKRTSRSWSYCNKIRISDRFEPEFQDIRKAILKEQYNACDEPGGPSATRQTRTGTPPSRPRIRRARRKPEPDTMGWL